MPLPGLNLNRDAIGRALGRLGGRVGGAIERYGSRDADRDAAAIAYGSLIATLPLLVLVAAISSRVLRDHPDARDAVARAVERALPGGGAMTQAGIDGAGRSADTTTAVALVAAGWATLGLIDRLRASIERAWGDATGEEGGRNIAERLANWARAWTAGRARDIVVGLVLAVVVLASALASSLALGGVGPSLGPVSTRLAGLVVTLAADWAVIVVLMAYLPTNRRRVRLVRWPALAAAVLIGVLKTAGTALVLGSAAAASAGYGVAAGIVAVAIAAYLAARIVLGAVYWAAAGTSA